VILLKKFIILIAFVSLFFGLIYYLAEGNKIIDLKIKYNILIEKMFYTIQILTSGQAISENNLINVISTLASLGNLSACIVARAGKSPLK
jgi:hypothetical protein